MAPEATAESPSIREVARQAGVSVATVSRVLNENGPVREETRQRVLEVAALGYVPHSAARSLIRRKTAPSASLLPDLYGEFFSEVIRGIDLAARARGLPPAGVQLAQRRRESRGRAARHARPRRRPGRDVAGRRRRSCAANLPRDAADRAAQLPASSAGSTRSDRQLRRRAARWSRHLAALGHRRIAFVAGPERNNDAQRAPARLPRRAGRALPGSRELVIQGDFTRGLAATAPARACSRWPRRPTAVFAANDAMAHRRPGRAAARPACAVPERHRGRRLRRHPDRPLPDAAAHHRARRHRRRSAPAPCERLLQRHRPRRARRRGATRSLPHHPGRARLLRAPAPTICRTGQPSDPQTQGGESMRSTAGSAQLAAPAARRRALRRRRRPAPQTTDRVDPRRRHATPTARCRAPRSSAVDTESGFRYRAATGADGSLRAAGLKPGELHSQGLLAGLQPSRAQVVQVLLGQDVEADFVLTLERGRSPRTSPSSATPTQLLVETRSSGDRHQHHAAADREPAAEQPQLPRLRGARAGRPFTDDTDAARPGVPQRRREPRARSTSSSTACRTRTTSSRAAPSCRTPAAATRSRRTRCRSTRCSPRTTRPSTRRRPPR